MTKSKNSHISANIQKSLKNQPGPFTLADVATKTGLPLHETKTGLTSLIAEYRGGLAATSQGEILYSFPTGFTKPWETQEKLTEIWDKTKKFTLGLLKFAVRAWITIVMVGYVVIFALILLALMFSKNSDRDNGPSFSGTIMFHLLFRTILDSIFYTFHPFSPFRINHYDYSGYQPRKNKTPFYERVNRFFFGPEQQKFDKNQAIKLTLQEIRAQKGRIGLLDVMRVTGLSKEKADPFMAELLLNHEGDILVSENGGIYYEFSEMRKSARTEYISHAPSIWQQKETLPPFTGNTSGSNMLIAGLNFFNLFMSSVAIANSWTLEKFNYILTYSRSDIPPELIPPPPEGTPLFLGWIPFIFSLALFAIPILRAFMRPALKAKINHTNGRRGLLKALLSSLSLKNIAEKILRLGWSEQAGVRPKEKELTQEIIKLGGELDIHDDGKTSYHFPNLAAEQQALVRARQKASHKETQIGDIIFSSEKN